MFNFTADSHPIHLHLTQYQVVEKHHIDFVDEAEKKMTATVSRTIPTAMA